MRLVSKGNRFHPPSLLAQMILSSIALVLLTAAAASLPAIWLIRGQLDRQAWAQVDQGSRATLALYAARQSELQALATLTAQRPTLQKLLGEGERGELLTYLGTLQEGSGLDLVQICDLNHRIVARVGMEDLGELCQAGNQSGFYILDPKASPHVWLYATQTLNSTSEGLPGTVIVGVTLDDAFAAEMRERTGLEHTLLVNWQPVVTSHASRPPATLDDAPQNKFTLDGHPYYASYLSLSEAGLDAKVALDVTEIAATQRRLVWALATSILLVVVMASLFGAYLAGRIGRPLDLLASAASSMSAGDLTRPLEVETKVREVTLVAHALEGARIDLQRTLGELRREKAWADHLLEAIVEGIVTLDRKGHITFFSHGAERITGWRRDEVLGQSCDQVFRPADTDRPFSQVIPSPGRRHKIPVEMRDGREAILAVTGARLLPPEGADARVALVFRDISEEEAIHHLLGHFLANVAHEFRTPLSAQAATVELLLDQAPDLTAAELQELLTSLHLGVLGLQTLIDNLLESASIEAGRFRVHPRPADLGEIIADAIGTMQPLLDKHGQSLVVQLPAATPVVQADPRRTAQVLINLLSNASKYGPDDAEIEVIVTDDGQWARIVVADSGPGVPPQHRDDLFRRFTHPGTGSTKAEVGVGLGLSVVRAIIQAHGGEVGIDDHPGGGSAFWFTLPAVKSQLDAAS
jgi:PAS domain S-box-containing protein